MSEQWPADQIERRAITTLIPQARNARTHSDKQVERLAAAIKEWGWTVPVLIDESGTIIAGHGRVLAAARLQLDQVPCVIARDWSEMQKRAYVIADNKLPELAEWDDELLDAELSDLKAADFDIGLMGFDEIDKALPNTNPQLGNLQYSVIVRCASEAEQIALLDRFAAEGLRCEALIT